MLIQVLNCIIISTRQVPVQIILSIQLFGQTYLIYHHSSNQPRLITFHVSLCLLCSLRKPNRLILDQFIYLKRVITQEKA